jgi:hypothetical protein
MDQRRRQPGKSGIAIAIIASVMITSVMNSIADSRNSLYQSRNTVATAITISIIADTVTIIAIAIYLEQQ